MSIVSSRTPEGEPNRCPICGLDVRVEISLPQGDSLCPHCGSLLWFVRTTVGNICCGSSISKKRKSRIISFIANLEAAQQNTGIGELSFLCDIGAADLQVLSLVMEIEREFGIIVPDEEAENIINLEKAVQYVLARIGDE